MQRKEPDEPRGSMFSRIVFTMISENDAIGKTRFEFIQDRWEGGDAEGKLCQVNKREDYLKLVKKLWELNKRFDNLYETVEVEGLHVPNSINPLFAFKISNFKLIIEKIFASEPKRPANNVFLTKTIPDTIVKPEDPVR